MGTYERIKKVGKYYYRVKVSVKEEYIGAATEEEYLARSRRILRVGRETVSGDKAGVLSTIKKERPPPVTAKVEEPIDVGEVPKDFREA